MDKYFFMNFIARFFSISIAILIINSISAQHVVPTKAEEFEKIKAQAKFNAKSVPQTVQYDVNFYHIKLDLNPSVRLINGNVTTYFTVTDSIMNSIFFDFSNNMSADSVIYHGITYTNQSTAGLKTVEFPFPAPLIQGTLDSLTIFYYGTPSGSPTGTPFARVNIPNGNLIWTLSEPYGAQEWWPCKNDLTDKADSVSISVTVPFGNRVASNGLLLSVDTVGTSHTFNWKTTYPTVAYLISIGAGSYDFYEEKYFVNGDSILMQHFLYSNQHVSQSSSGIQPFMELFDSLFGVYPFIKEKYGHASFTFGGGMEHQTISSMGGYGGELKAHELAHQWFGDKVTCGSWKDLWLNESYATYLTGLTYQFGVVHPKNLWLQWLNFTEAGGRNYPNGAVYRTGNDTANVNSLFNGQVYSKGAITLHTLRWKIGDSAFFAAVKNYITDPALEYSFASTAQMQQHFETSSGQNLTEFFNDWIYGKGYPQYSSYWAQNGSNFNLNVQQSPTDPSVPFFNIPVPYRLTGPNLDTIIVVDPASTNQTFNLTISQVITDVQFDPRNDIFARDLITTGINQIDKESFQFFIAPNPATNLISVVSNKDVKVNSVLFYDSKGSVVLNSSSAKKINISSLKSGIYFIQIETNNRINRIKMIKN